MSEILPDLAESFRIKAGWGDALVEPLPGDASFRRYFRLRRGNQTAMLMYAPPPHEDPRPFLHVGKWLVEQGLRAPKIYAEDAPQGLVLIEDFGTDRMRDWLDDNPTAEEATYQGAITALCQLHKCPPGPFGKYDMPTYLREVGLFTEWFCPAADIAADAAGYEAAWAQVLEPLLERQEPGVTVLRDYHAENIMLLPDGEQGLIDFQDALVGHPAYDLVSLLQDARREVPPELEALLLNAYTSGMDTHVDFAADYARLGAQRNAKIVGIFTRLWKRDNKPHYLSMIPRVWEAMERDLRHPVLAPVASWFDANIPAEWRARYGAGLDTGLGGGAAR